MRNLSWNNGGRKKAFWPEERRRQFALLSKVVQQNMRDGKAQALIVGSSILVAACLLFLNVTIGVAVANTAKLQAVEQSGNAVFTITAGEESPSWMVPEENLRTTPEGVSLMRSFVVSASAPVRHGEELPMTVHGMSLADLERLTTVKWLSRINEDFSGKAIVLNQWSANVLGVETGDALQVKVNNTYSIFRVYGIVENAGIFNRSGRAVVAMPLDSASRFWGYRDTANRLYVTTEDHIDQRAAEEWLTSRVPRYDIRPVVDPWKIERKVRAVTQPLWFVMAMAAAICVYLSETSFRVLLHKRMKMVGILKSMGAKERDCRNLLLLECVVLGSLGALLGSIVGFILLQGVRLSFGYSANIDLLDVLRAVFLTLLFGIALSGLCAILSAKRIAGTSIRALLTDTTQEPNRRKKRRQVWLLYLVTMILLWLFRPVGLVSDILLLAFFSALPVLVVPLIARKLPVVLHWTSGKKVSPARLYANRFSSIKTHVGNAILLAMLLGLLSPVNMLFSEIGRNVEDMYDDLQYDIWISYGEQIDRSYLQGLYHVEGVSDLLPLYETTGIIEGTTATIGQLQAMQPDKLGAYYSFVETLGDERISELNQQRAILLGKMAADHLQVKEGDWLPLKTSTGVKPYLVAGIFDTLLYNGDVAIVSDRYYRMDYQPRYYSDVYIQTRRPADQVKAAIKERASGYVQAMTAEEMKRDNVRQNNQILGTIRVFTILVLLLSCVGMLNNIVLAQLRSKKELAIFKSMGMADYQVLWLSLRDSGIILLYGIPLGLLVGRLVLTQINRLLEWMGIPIHCQWQSVTALSISGGFAFALLLITSMAAMKMTRTRMLDDLTYE